jgi:dTMP kinase
MTTGKLIVLEGINGCGKGTQLFKLINGIYELDKSQTVFVTREPNEFDENGKNARRILKADGDPYTNATEAVKYFAMNREAHNAIFGPLIERGVTVVSDRYYHSNFAFQHAQGVPYEEIAEQNYKARIPDLTIILDVPVEVAFERLAKRDGQNRRKFDSNLEFMQKARTNYLELPQIVDSYLNDFHTQVVDGTQSVEKVAQDIWQAYTTKFGPFHQK